MESQQIKEFENLAFGMLDRMIKLKTLSIEEQKLKNKNSSTTSEVMKDFEQKFPSGSVIYKTGERKGIVESIKSKLNDEKEESERMWRNNRPTVVASDFGQEESIHVFSILMNDCDCLDCEKDKAEARKYLAKIISKQEENVPVYENIERLTRRLKVAEQIEQKEKY